jgi:citrate lyase beta subunit
VTGIGEARSLLFVPGTRANRYDRALASGADPARLVTDVENALSIGGKLAIRPRHIAAINHA